MNQPLIRAVLLSSIACFMLCSPATATNMKTQSGIPAPAAKIVLQKGMSAETIMQHYGQPYEVTPIAAEPVKAEKWTYRRMSDSRIVQTANTERRVQSFIGLNNGGKSTIGDVIIPDYRLKLLRTYQVTNLLLIDGKLELGRQWQERSEQFAD
jgi:hypothetical protein